MFSTDILTLPAIFLAFMPLLEFWLPSDRADKSAIGMIPGKCIVSIDAYNDEFIETNHCWMDGGFHS